MDYSLLVGIHNVDRTGDESFLPVPDQKRNQGQKPLYCTTLEAIHGEGKGNDAPQYSERLDYTLKFYANEDDGSLLLILASFLLLCT